MKAYRIRSGCAFKIDALTVKNGGDVIELEDDIAQLHADKLEAAAPAEVDTVAIAEADVVVAAPPAVGGDVDDLGQH